MRRIRIHVEPADGSWWYGDLQGTGAAGFGRRGCRFVQIDDNGEYLSLLVWPDGRAIRCSEWREHVEDDR